jgi:hypothetical protein
MPACVIFQSRWPAGNLRQIKELAISSIAASLLAAEGDAGLTLDESPVLSFPG